MSDGSVGKTDATSGFISSIASLYIYSIPHIHMQHIFFPHVYYTFFFFLQMANATLFRAYLSFCVEVGFTRDVITRHSVLI